MRTFCHIALPKVPDTSRPLFSNGPWQNLPPLDMSSSQARIDPSQACLKAFTAQTLVRPSGNETRMMRRLRQLDPCVTRLRNSHLTIVPGARTLLSAPGVLWRSRSKDHLQQLKDYCSRSLRDSVFWERPHRPVEGSTLSERILFVTTPRVYCWRKGFFSDTPSYQKLDKKSRDISVST